MIVKLLVKEVKDCVGLLNHIQEVEVGIFGICRWDGCASRKTNKRALSCTVHFRFIHLIWRKCACLDLELMLPFDFTT